MAFKASFKFSDSREFDVLNWRVCKFNLEVQLRSVFLMKKTLRVCPSGRGA